MRRAGILMPVASLPGPYGIGDFGEAAETFIRYLKKAGFSEWQVLPLNPLGYGHSPYQCYSSHAIDEIYVSLEQLQARGLLDHLPRGSRTSRVHYEEARFLKRQALRKAFDRFKPEASFETFVQQPWVREYAIFMALREAHGSGDWTTCEPE